jgi:hypothetical protein
MSESTPAPTSRAPATKSALARYWWVIGLVIAGVIAAIAAAYASGDPDGLDWVSQEQGFEGAGQEPGFQVLPDYTIPGVDGTVSTVIAGLVGIAIVVVIVLLVGRLLARRRAGGAG